MRSLVGAVVACAVATAIPSHAAGQTNDYAMTRARTLYGQLHDNSSCEAALPSAREFVASSDFSTLPEQARREFLFEVMQCAWTMEDGRAAAAAANAAGELGAPWADVARLRLGYAFDDDALAVAALVDLAQHSPDQLRGEDSRYIWGALNAADRQDASGATSLRLHELLVANAYVPPDGSPDDALRLHHARLLIRRGDLAAARSRLETVIEPQLVMMLRIDRSFDPIRGDPAFERRLDVAAAANAALERARRIASERPRSLDSILGVAQALRALGRHEEALAVLNPAISAAQRPDAAKRFDDVAEKLNWLLNEKAYALYDLGRVAEAHDVFGASIAAGEDGQWSVSQVINFASMLDSEGHARDALEVLRTVGRASPYGDMWAAAVRVCSSEQLHDVTTRDEALTFMRAHEQDNVAALSQALLCINDLDGAAALFIRRLANDRQREGALQALQRYRARDEPAQPHHRLLLQRLAQVRDRADVRAAVEAVGRIEEIPLFTTYWGDV